VAMELDGSEGCVEDDLCKRHWGVVFRRVSL